MTKIFIALIVIYQKILSPDHSWVSFYFPHGLCRYSPSCSEYAKQALERHGLVKGLFLSVHRVLRCNPYASFGPDPVPGGNSNPQIHSNVSNIIRSIRINS